MPGLTIQTADIALGLRARTSAAVLDEMLGRLASGSAVASAWLGSAGRVSRLVVDRGVAVFRRACAGAAARPPGGGGSSDTLLLGFATIPGGADFGSHDGSPVSLVFLVADRTPDGGGYQSFLSALFGRIAEPGLRDALLGARTADEAVAVLRADTTQQAPSRLLNATA